jgi:recombination protein RecA
MGKNNNTKAGKIDINSMKKFVNKSVGLEIAHNITEDNPTQVIEWIPTGARWLDSIICRGKLAGIPVGKITEIAGLSSAGKSYMAVQIAANAQAMGHCVVYFDAESAIDPVFLQQSGIDPANNFMYVQAVSVEKTLETIESLMSEYPDAQFLFIWDSIAATSSEKDLEGDFNPQSSMAVKPRIFAKAFPKLTIPLANQQCTLLLINQLKTNITSNIAEAMTTPYIAPGGKALEYFSSLRIWLTKRKARASYVTDNTGLRVGSEVKAKIEKSRFGSEGRTCGFKIIWGNEVRVQDEESWLEAIKASGTERFKTAGGWCYLTDSANKEHKFRAKQWASKLEDSAFRKAVYDIMDDEIIRKFDSEGKNFGIDEESES